MNWEAIGAIGEVVGAAGVICSLIYLGVQIRRSTTSAKADTFQRLTDYVTSWNNNVALDPRYAAFLIEASDPAHQPTATEQIRLRAFATTLFRHWDNVIYQFESGTMDRERMEGFLAPMPGFLAFPRVQNLWRGEQNTYSQALKDRVNEHLSRRGPG